MRKLVLAILLVSVFSCNKGEKKEVKEDVQTEVVENKPKELVVEINYKSNKSDDFKLSLNNIVINNKQKKNIQIVEKVNASSSFENIRASFGVDNISKTFNINLGNKEVKTIEIQSINMSYGKNSIAISPSDLNKYFGLNKFVSLDKKTKTLTTKKVDGKHTPTMILKPSTYKALVK